MKTLIIALSLFSTDTLPPKATLLHAIDSFYQIQTASELLEYQIAKKGEWLKYLPTIGIQYTLDGKPRPTFSFSSSILYSAQKDRQSLKAKRVAIIERNKIEAQKSKIQLQKALTDYEVLLQELETRKEMLQIDALLFQIDQQRYENLEMPPSDFLKAKKSFLLQQQAFRQFENSILELRRWILMGPFPP